MVTESKNDINDLEKWCKQNGEQGQRILEEWDWEENWKNGFLLAPCDVKPFSGRKLWWKCRECGSSYEMVIASRTAGRQGCSKCGHKRGGAKLHENAINTGADLYTWCQKNGERGNLLLEEWDTERNQKELGVTINNVTYGCGKKVYWKCLKCRASFLCSITHRTLCHTDCTNCRRVGTSYPEQFIYYGLKQICPHAVNREKFFGGLEYDIYVPEWNLFIEYGSSYYHHDKGIRDQYKKDICLQNGGKFISIMDDENSVRDIFEPERIVVNVKEKDAYESYEKILAYILELNGHCISEIDIGSAHASTIKRLGKNVEDGKDVKTLFPELVKEWISELNNGVQPEDFSAGSHYRVNWKCTKCGNEWDTTIKSRIRFKTGCPKCRYSIFEERTLAPNHTQLRYKTFSLQHFI